MKCAMPRWTTAIASRHDWESKTQVGEITTSVFEHERHKHSNAVLGYFSVFELHGLFFDPRALDVVERLTRSLDTDFDGIFKTRFGRGDKLGNFSNRHCDTVLL